MFDAIDPNTVLLRNAYVSVRIAITRYMVRKIGSIVRALFFDNSADMVKELVHIYRDKLLGKAFIAFGRILDEISLLHEHLYRGILDIGKLVFGKRGREDFYLSVVNLHILRMAVFQCYFHLSSPLAGSYTDTLPSWKRIAVQCALTVFLE